MRCSPTSRRSNVALRAGRQADRDDCMQKQLTPLPSVIKICAAASTFRRSLRVFRAAQNGPQVTPDIHSTTQSRSASYTMRSQSSIAGKRCSLLTAIILCLFSSTLYTMRASSTQNPPPTPKDLGQLLPGNSSHQDMNGGDTHVFRVPLSPHKYLRAIVSQEGIDVTVSFYAPGTELAAVMGTSPALIQMDSPNGSHGRESVSLVAPASGDYLLVVRSGDKGARPGKYKVELQSPREPTEADLQRVNAEAAYVEGKRLGKGGTEASGKEAVAKYTEALGLWRLLGDRYSEALTLHTLGQTYHQARGRLDPARDNLAAALDSLNQALAIFRELNDLVGQAMVSNDTGAAIRDLDNPRNALPFYDRAYALYESANDDWGKAQIQNNIGYAFARLGDFREALSHYQQSLPIWQTVRDRNMEANAYNNIGGALESLGNATEALAKYQQALTIWQELGSDRLASAYINLAAASQGFGDMQIALDNYERGLALHREKKNAAGEANALNNIGMVHADMGDTETALEYFQQSLSISKSLNQKRGQAASFDNIGYAYYMLRRYAEAPTPYEEARRLYVEAGDKQGESTVLTHLGMLYAVTNNIAKALDSFEQAKKIQQDSGLKLRLAITLSHLANAYTSAKNPERAVATFRDALNLSTELGDEIGRARTLYGLAYAENMRGNLTTARDTIAQAIKIVESLRARTTNQQFRTTLLASKYDYYKLEIDVKMRLAEQSASGAFVESAFESSEHARARSLADLLSERRADIRFGIKPELAAEELGLKRDLEVVSDRLLFFRGSNVRPQDRARVSTEMEALKKEFDALSASYDRLLERIRRESPRYAQLTQPAPPQASRLKELLDSDTMLLEYSLGDERSYLWAVTRSGIEGHRLRGRAEIEPAAEGFRDLIATYRLPKAGENEKQYLDRIREFPQQYAERAAELSQLILGPVAGRIGSKRLVIVADGALQFIPFEALFAPGEPGANVRQPLGITNEVVYLPSASTLALIRALPRVPSATKNVAVFADPVFGIDDDRVAAAHRRTIPGSQGAEKLVALRRALRDVDLTEADATLQRLLYTRDEANAIMSVVPAGSGMQAMGFNASRSNATSPRVSGYKIVHFATHALLDNKRPELSGLVMSLVDERGRPQDGFLRLGDIYNLKLPIDMVVLSACRTGIGREVSGEGLIGLTRGFMYAGASKVVATLWKVDDEATAVFMKSFYRHMLKERMPASSALRLARSEVMQTRAEWRSPYFWAGFVLQGDWRSSQLDQSPVKSNQSSGVRR